MKDENEAALPLKYKAKSSLSLCQTHEHFKLVWNLVLAFLINKLRPKSVNATGLSWPTTSQSNKELQTGHV